MTTLRRVHVARKVHKRGCSVCDGDIKPGQTYERQTVTPGDEEGGNSGDHMISLKGHLNGSCEQQERTGRYVDADREAALWNAAYPVGAPVVFYPEKDREGRLRGAPTLARTKTPAVSGGRSHAVLWLDRPYGCGTGAVSVSFLVPVVSRALWGAAHEPHEMESCDCGDGYGCPHGAWCSPCSERAEARGRDWVPEAAWPCWPLLDALGITEPAVYGAVEGLLWERAHRRIERSVLPA